MKKTALLIAVAGTILLLFFVPLDKEIIIYPLEASDSDGKSSDNIINAQKTFDYFLILKTYPYGFVRIDKWQNSTVGDIKRASIHTEWKTNKGFGAGNIFVGYSINGNEWNETGPFSDSDNQAYIDLPVDYDISMIKFRFRGEDLDFAADAITWVRTNMIVTVKRFGLFGLLAG